MTVKDEVVCPSCKSMSAEKAKGLGTGESDLDRYNCQTCGYVWWETEETIYKNEFFNEIIDFFQEELKAAKEKHIRNYTEKEAKRLLEIAKGKDLDTLAREWDYVVQTEDGNFYWTNKKDDYARII